MNRIMNARGFPALLLMLAWLAADMATTRLLHERGTTWPDWLAAAFLGVLFGQVAIACWWLVGGQVLQVCRLSAFMLLLAAVSVAAASITDGQPSWGKWLVLLSVYATSLACVLAAAKAAGLELGQSSLLDSGRQRNLRSLQFDVAQLFSWTTASALVLAAGRWFAWPGKPFAAMLAFCLLIAAASFAVLLLANRTRLAITLLIAFALLTPTLPVLLSRTGIPPPSEGMLALLVAAQVMTIVGSLQLLRLMRVGSLGTAAAGRTV
jgi:hypothetical protein